MWSQTETALLVLVNLLTDWTLMQWRATRRNNFCKRNSMQSTLSTLRLSVKLKVALKNDRSDSKSKNWSIKIIWKNKSLHASHTPLLSFNLSRQSLRVKKTSSRDCQFQTANISKYYINRRKVISLVFSKRKVFQVKLKSSKCANAFIKITKGERTRNYRSSSASL